MRYIIVGLYLMLNNGILMAKAPCSVQDISIEEVRQKQLNGERFTLLDVRSEETYAWKHIKGAVSLPMRDIRNRFKEIPSDQLIIVYCKGTDCGASRVAAVQLLEAGVENVREMQSGIDEWEAKGYPVEGEFNQPQIISSGTVKSPDYAETFTISTISQEELYRRMNNGEYIIILDFRPVQDYAERRIRTATQIPIDDLQWKPNPTPIVVYGERTSDIAVRNAVLKFKKSGFPNVYELDGGLQAWLSSKYPLYERPEMVKPAQSLGKGTTAFWQEYANDKWGYSIAYPSFMTVRIVFENIGVSDTVIKQRVAFTGASDGIIEVDVWTNSSGLSLKEWYEQNQKRFLNEQTIISSDTVAGCSAYSIEQPRSGNMFEQCITLIRHGKNILRIRCIAEDGAKVYRSEERRVGKECRSRWSPYH